MLNVNEYCGVKILNFVFFGVKKSGISAFFVSAENGASVDKMTNIRYGYTQYNVHLSA